MLPRALLRCKWFSNFIKDLVLIIVSITLYSGTQAKYLRKVMALQTANPVPAPQAPKDLDLLIARYSTARRGKKNLWRQMNQSSTFAVIYKNNSPSKSDQRRKLLLVREIWRRSRPMRKPRRPRSSLKRLLGRWLRHLREQWSKISRLTSELKLRSTWREESAELERCVFREMRSRSS